MKNKSVFSQLILLIVLSLVCILLTIGLALLFGSAQTTIFDFKNLNFSNMIPIFIIGGIISCFVIGTTILFISRTVFLKFKDYMTEEEKEFKGEKK